MDNVGDVVKYVGGLCICVGKYDTIICEHQIGQEIVCIIQDPLSNAFLVTSWQATPLGPGPGPQRPHQAVEGNSSAKWYCGQKSTIPQQPLSKTAGAPKGGSMLGKIGE